MKIWKGIAIAGIWAGLGFAVWATNGAGEAGRNITFLGSICACVATCWVASSEG